MSLKKLRLLPVSLKKDLIFKLCECRSVRKWNGILQYLQIRKTILKQAEPNMSDIL